MFFALALLCASLCIVVFTLNAPSKKNLLFTKLPSPRSVPLLGVALEVNIPVEEYFQFLLNIHKRLGERIIAYTVGYYFVALSNPGDIEKLLTSTAHINKGTTYKLFRPWLADSLFLSGGEKWQKRRKMLTSTFHFRILEDFLVIFNEQADVLVDILREDFADGKERDICLYLSRCALDIIGETAMGKKFDTQRQKVTPYLAAVETACKVMMYRAPRPHFWSDFIFSLTPYGQEHKAVLKTLHDFTDTVIKEKKADKTPLVRRLSVSGTDPDEIYWHGKRRMAFLDLLLHAQKNPENSLTDLDIREEVDVFMFGGHDTSSANLSWTIFLLGSHPQYQSQLNDELDSIFGEDKTRPITSKDLTEMKYLEMCIKESFRLFPVAAVISRSLTSDLYLDEEVTIPAGYDAIVSVLGVHRNEKIYPNPTEYSPDRFLPENLRSRHPFAFLPFSAGPRNCIGQKFAMMEMKVILANLFRQFTVEAAEPLADVVVMLEAITRPRDGLKVRLVPR